MATKYLDTHDALKHLWGLYWNARCPDLIWGVPSLPKDNQMSLKIKESIAQVALALTEANDKNRELEKKLLEKNKEIAELKESAEKK